MSEKGIESIKVVLLGEAGVGKTSIIQQFTTHKFDPDILSSISSQYTAKTIDFIDLNAAVKFDLWDTAGQEKYRALAKIFYKDAKIIIFVYDITNKKSFEGIKKYWFEQVKIHSEKYSILALVANKDDLYEKQQVSNEEGQAFADEIDAIFQVTSAKNDSGIAQLFDNIGRKYLVPDFDYRDADKKAKTAYEMKKKCKEEDDDDEEEKKKGKVKLDNVKNVDDLSNKKKGGCC